MKTINPLLEAHLKQDSLMFMRLSESYGIPTDILITKRPSFNTFIVQIKINIPSEISDKITDKMLLLNLRFNSLTDFLLNSLCKVIEGSNGGGSFAIVTNNLKNNIQEKIKCHEAFDKNKEVEIIIKFDDTFKNRIEGLYSLFS